ncbi:hypothetical protein [Plantactinospora sp. KLBMP9567]|uniref:hypothetical protein n=1 Tax=Plantactinospora sp. KLBMP9567 TaxID=3085900 RepID=UPI00298169E8|nr:hypothetical protein [Plantactinospora sp. KLBMP9567]MDW5326818.1 hypothetical protein [Plantactinospora sp. KLBMP9567]
MRSRLRRLYADDRQFTWTARIDHVRTGQGLRRCIRVRCPGSSSPTCCYSPSAPRPAGQ